MRIAIVMVLAASGCDEGKKPSGAPAPTDRQTAREIEPRIKSRTERDDPAQDSPKMFGGVARDIRIDRERRAMRAIYERCSQANDAWKEGVEMEATYAFTAKKVAGEESVNVGAKLPRRDEVARGNVLWYQVDFVAGSPARIMANKKISAELCGLAREGALVDL